MAIIANPVLSPPDPLECFRVATDRIEVYPDNASADLEGVEYTCPAHVAEVLAAVVATGAAPARVPVGEREPLHRCGDVVSYCGAVAL